MALASIRAPARGATRTQCLMTSPHEFQSAPPRGGRLVQGDLFAVVIRFQSAPPRGGRHEIDVEAVLVSHVSIRAPARGATAGGLTARQRGT